MGVLRPDLIIKNVVPVIMAGIIGIYGLVVAVLVSDGRIPPPPPPSLETLSGSDGDSGASATFVYGVYSAWCWTECWTCWSCRWVCDWNCWRCRSSWNGSTAQIICWDDFDSHFR